MKLVLPDELIIGEYYAVGSLFSASRACLVNTVMDWKTCTLRVGVYNELTDEWSPSTVRISQVIGTWNDYLAFKGEVKKETGLRQRFKALGINVVHQSPYVRISEDAAERLLNMLEGQGKHIPGTTLRIIK